MKVGIPWSLLKIEFANHHSTERKKRRETINNNNDNNNNQNEWKINLDRCQATLKQ